MFYSDKKMKTKILLYNNFWEMEWNLLSISVRAGFELINQRAHFNEADVVVFHMPNMDKAELEALRFQKGANQLLVLFLWNSTYIMNGTRRKQ